MGWGGKRKKWGKANEQFGCEEERTSVKSLEAGEDVIHLRSLSK